MDVFPLAKKVFIKYKWSLSYVKEREPGSVVK